MVKLSNKPLRSDWSFLKAPKTSKPELPYKCDTCERTFARPVDLQNHKRRAHRLEYENAKFSPKLVQKRKKQTPKEQRDKARKDSRNTVPKHLWLGLIAEYDQDKSKGKEDFSKAHPEINNPSKRISTWRLSLLKKSKKQAEIDSDSE